MKVLLPVNIVWKSSFFDVAWLLDASLECDKLTLKNVMTSRLVPAKKGLWNAAR